MKVTKENVVDGSMFKPLLEEATTQTNVKRVLADGAYDSRDNFQFLHDSNIEPGIEVRKIKNYNLSAMNIISVL